MDGLIRIQAMLFDSSVRRELWRSFVGTLIVLLTVVMTMVLTRILADAAGGVFAPSDVSLMLGYTLIGQLPMLLSLSVFVAVVSVLSRYWRDSEMVIWQVSGTPQMRFVRPLWQMAWPVLIAVAMLTLGARPWAQTQTQLLKDRYEKRSDIARVQPGQFQSSADGSRVFFIDSHSDGEKTGKNVLMVITREDQEAVITAKEGFVETIDGQRYLLLNHGERTQTDLTTGEKMVSRFDSARVLVGEVDKGGDPQLEARATPTLDLLTSTQADQRAELVWRVGLIIATFNMMLIGLGLAAGNTRRSSNWNLVLALLVFVVYFNLLTLMQSWVAQGKLSALGSLLGVHGGVTVLALLRIWLRDGGWTMLTRRRA